MSQLWVINSKAEKVRRDVWRMLVVNMIVFFGVGCFCISFNGIGFILCLLFGVVLFFVFRSLIIGFQKNVEHLFLTLGKGIFEDIRFDVDEGVDSCVLEKSRKLGNFVERETFNTIIGKRYLATEELLYNLLGHKESLKKVMFEGIILKIDAKGKEIDGMIDISNGRKIFRGNIGEEFRKKIILLMKILGVMECIIETIDDSVFISMSGGKLYYQFSIFKKVDINKNVSRIKLFDEAVGALVDEILL